MSVVETLREFSEVWKLFSEIPDDATLNVELASLYLGISVKSLARYRQNGGGPAYIQYQVENSKARNQRVNYLLKDLRAWRDNHKVQNTMHAAQIRGLTFTSLTDLCEPHPFWLSNFSGQKIISHALTTSDDLFRKLFSEPNVDIVWISVEQAIFKEWENKNERIIWHNIFITILNNLSYASEAAQERYTMNDVLGS